jgi:GTPase KRas protein
MRDQYVRCGEGFLLLFSLVDRKSFESILGYYQDIIMKRDVEEDCMYERFNREIGKPD